MNKDCILEIHF